MNEYFKIGKLAATFGVNGEMILQHNLGKKTVLKGLENLFIEESPNSFIPYFITGSKLKSDDQIYISLDGINSKEEAQLLTRKEVWLSAEDFKKYASTSAPISFLGFMIVHKKEELGEVLEVIEQPQQILCRIMIGGKEVLIPIHENTLEKVDKKNRRLYVNLPEGLVDIYKNS